MVVVSKRSSCGRQVRQTSVRLLVMGDRQVGKSATIVRYTTGRFIDNYADPNNHWLYRHQLGFDSHINSSLLAELVEQRDLQFSNLPTENLNMLQQTESKETMGNQRTEVKKEDGDELEELLCRLRWANAYVVVYAINSMDTFNKAIKYLNLIANNINSADATQTGSKVVKSQQRRSSQAANQCNVKGCACSSGTRKRPILLMANKRDLEAEARQVSSSDGHRLAMRHQCLFAEVSAAETCKLIESYMSNLIERVERSTLHVSERKMGPLNQLPTIDMIFGQAGVKLSAPVWANLVKTRQSEYGLAQSSQLATVPKLEAVSFQTLLASHPVSSNTVQVAKSYQTTAIRRPLAPSRLTADNNQSTDLGYSASERHITGNSTELSAKSSKPVSANSYLDRYETLISSFKRASMAIVSSKNLSKGVCKPTTKAMLMRGSQDQTTEVVSMNDVMLCEPISENKTSTWFKSHLKSYGRDKLDNVSETGSLDKKFRNISNQSVKPSYERSRRQLFRYKGRTKTVAFEATANNDSSSNHETESLESFNLKSVSLGLSKQLDRPSKEIESNSGSSCGYNSTRSSSSSRSNSSLSATETYYN